MTTETKMRRRRKKYDTPLGNTAAAAAKAGLTYGKYVAAEESSIYRLRRTENKPSTYVSRDRTIIESLDQELRNPETRAAWLHDPEAIKELERRSEAAENRVRAFCEATELIITARNTKGVIGRTTLRHAIAAYQKGMT